jgi:hypothetical protein
VKDNTMPRKKKAAPGPKIDPKVGILDHVFDAQEHIRKEFGRINLANGKVRVAYLEAMAAAWMKVTGNSDPTQCQLVERSVLEGTTLKTSWHIEPLQGAPACAN